MTHSSWPRISWGFLRARGFAAAWTGGTLSTTRSSSSGHGARTSLRRVIFATIRWRGRIFSATSGFIAPNDGMSSWATGWIAIFILEQRPSVCWLQWSWHDPDVDSSANDEIFLLNSRENWLLPEHLTRV